MRILIIEDDQATTKIIQSSLKQEGFVCDATESGEEGFDLARHYQGEHDLIILDQVLPDLGLILNVNMQT